MNTLESTSFKWILTKLGTYLVLKRIRNPIDFQGQGHQVKFVDEGIRYALHCPCLIWKRGPQNLMSSTTTQILLSSIWCNNSTGEWLLAIPRVYYFIDWSMCILFLICENLLIVDFVFCSNMKEPRANIWTLLFFLNMALFFFFLRLVQHPDSPYPVRWVRHH